MARIQIASASNGSPVRYTLQANPFFYDAQDSRFISEFTDNNGDYIYNTNGFDSRVRILRWETYKVGSQYIASTIGYFRSVEGQIRYFNFNNMSSANGRWDTARPTWKKARVINVKATYRPGGALQYDNVEVLLQPER